MDPTTKSEGYAWKIVRLLIGPAVMAAVFLKGFSWPHSILRGVQLNFYTGFVFVGALLFSTGLLGILRLRMDRKPGAPPRSGTSKLAWFAAAVLLAALLGGGEQFAGRVVNVRAAERTRFEDASSRNTADSWNSWRYFLRHHHGEPLVRTYDDPETRDRFKKVFETTLLMDDDRSALHQLSVRMEQQAGGAAEWEDYGWWLDTFTPVREHARAGETAYEDARFREAAADGSPGQLRAFRLEFPKGRHADEAKALLQARYREVEKRYADLVASKQANPESVAGVKSLLAWLRENDVDARMVPVCFLPVEGLDGDNLEEAVRKVVRPKEVVPVSPQFTAEVNQKRQYSVTYSMDKALRAVMGSLVALREAKADETRRQARFLVGYKVFGTGQVYSRVSENALPPDQRTVYVGIGMRFDCTIQVPSGGAPLDEDLGRGHRFTLTARPAPNFTAVGDKSGVSAGAVYSTMASTAFDNFRDSLIRGYGLEVPRD